MVLHLLGGWFLLTLAAVSLAIAFVTNLALGAGQSIECGVSSG